MSFYAECQLRSFAPLRSPVICRCLRFMSEYNSCLFQGYGVLADPPSKLRTVAKTDSFVILDWNKPKRLADTVSTYHVKFRRLGVGDDYLTVEKVLLHWAFWKKILYNIKMFKRAYIHYTLINKLR